MSRRGADRLASGHCWVYAGDIEDRGAAAPGDVVRVVDPRGRALGVAHYSSTSQICLRLLSRLIEPAGRDFYLRRLQKAAAWRRRVVCDSEACRLVHGEGDQLPGLIIDRYGDCLVMQLLDQGMDRAQEEIVEALEGLFAPRAIVARNDAAVRAREALPLETRVVRGELAGPVEVAMNGLRLRVDLLKGQKTGLFLDQRENYVAAAQYARSPVLDCFTSTGGFALHMAGRCESVEAADSAAEALETAAANARLNGLDNIVFRETNVFDLLAGYAASGRRFATIVLDPPAFAKSRDAVEAARRGYKEINLRALKLLEPGGVLVTCSCSHHLGEAGFLEIIAAAALDARRELRVIERRTQARDHPILLTVPETHYLKCLILAAL